MDIRKIRSSFLLVSKILDALISFLLCILCLSIPSPRSVNAFFFLLFSLHGIGKVEREFLEAVSACGMKMIPGRAVILEVQVVGVSP